MSGFKKKAVNYTSIGILVLILILISITSLVNHFKTDVNKQYANELVKKCKLNPYWKVCYSRELEKLNKNISFKDTLYIMNLLVNLDGKTKFCHILAHNVIASEFEKDPANWPNLLKYLDDPYSCSTGFIHGLVEAEKKFNPSIKFDEKGIEMLCQKIFSVTKTGYYYPCAHASGHVLLVETFGKIDQAAAICNKLPLHMQDPCLEGIFMEYINRPNLTYHGLTNGPLNTDEITESSMIKQCNTYDGKTTIGCWKALSLVINQTKGGDLTKIKEVCNKSNSTAARRECYFRAFDYSLNEDTFESKQIESLCRDYENSDQEFRCYDNAIIALLYKKEQNYKLAEALCESASIAFQNQCRNIKDRYFGKSLSDKNEVDVKSKVKAILKNEGTERN